MKRSKGKGKTMDNKNNMDGKIFEAFLHEICKKVIKRHKKVASVMDNTTYHIIFTEDIPRPFWPLEKLKEFCEKKGAHHYSNSWEARNSSKS
jgi:hypothetical protein